MQPAQVSQNFPMFNKQTATSKNMPASQTVFTSLPLPAASGYHQSNMSNRLKGTWAT